MSDLLITASISGGETTASALEKIHQNAANAATSIDSFQTVISNLNQPLKTLQTAVDDLFKSFPKSVPDPFSKSTKGGKDLNKAVTALNKGIDELNADLINSEQFTLKYGKALSDLKNETKKSYGENTKYVGTINDVSKALQIQKDRIAKVTEAEQANDKALKEQAIALAKAEKAQQKLAAQEKKLQQSLVGDYFKKNTATLKKQVSETEKLISA